MNKILILLVEDNPADVLFLREALENDPLSSFELAPAERLSQALAMSNACLFDVILLDLGLPDSQGLETFTRLHQAQPDTPIVILSGQMDESLALTAVQAGAQDYLVKGPQGFFASGRSIRYAIERQHAQEALRQSEENYRQLAQQLEARVKERTAEVEDLYNNAPTGYHSLDINGRFSMVNRTELDWLGYTRAELVGVKNFDDLLTPSGQAYFTEEFPLFKQRGWIKDAEFDLIRKDGSLLSVLLNATAIYDPDGTYIQSRSSIVDITERKITEDALRASRERLNFLLAQTPAMIFTARLGANLPITFMSDSVRTILGYEAHQYMDDSGFWMSVVHPDDIDQRLKVGQALETYGHTIWENRMRRADGEYHWMSNGISLLRDAQGEPLEIIGYSVDVNEEKKAQEALSLSEAQLRRSRDELSAANAALEQAARMKDGFLATMSHELRTPLTGILGLSEALQLKTYGGLNEKQLQALEMIESSGRHLLSLINDILDLSKIEAGKLDMQFEAFSLLDVCQASLQLTRGLAHQKKQKVSFAIHPAEPTLRADPRRLKQMLVNLLSNAIKFTPEGGSLGLTVEGSIEQQLIWLTVWDKGIGIKSEDLPKLFQPFVQLDSRLARQSEGTGLGLSLVQRMAELHGGSMQITSTPGEGSRFTIVLPWIAQDLVLVEKSDNETGVQQTSLTVEDSELDAEQITRFLRSLGITNIVSPVGLGAVELAADSKPDVILLDLYLPDKSGLDVLAELKADARTQHIPVVITSIEERHAQAMALGAAGYLVKPFSLAEMRSELTRVGIEANSPASVMTFASMKTPRLVLLVDDNEFALKMISDFLETKNLRVIGARSGAEMLKVAPEIHPDIILMDIQMPGMDGVEAMRRVRAHPDALVAAVPIIALTALAMSGDRERCLEAGATDYLSKPVVLKKLALRIHELVSNRH